MLINSNRRFWLNHIWSQDIKKSIIFIGTNIYGLKEDYRLDLWNLGFLCQQNPQRSLQYNSLRLPKLFIDLPFSFPKNTVNVVTILHYFTFCIKHLIWDSGVDAFPVHCHLQTSETYVEKFW